MSSVIKNFLHFDPKTVSEAVSLLGRYGKKARIIAGGSDLLTVLKDRIKPEQPEVLINLKSIPGLDYIKEDTGGLKIGALATLDDIENNSIVKSKYGVLAQATRAVGVWQTRSMGTIGGNLCQEVRCWYYRSPRNFFYCFRKGGALCFAVGGDNRSHAILGGAVCFAVCPSDMAIALVALDASVKAVGSGGERTIKLSEFYTVLATALKPDEIVTEVQVPALKPGTKGTFIKFRTRKAFDFAIASVAAVITTEAGSVSDARIVLGGVAPFPYRATKAEDALRGKAISDSTAEAAANAAVAEATPLSMNGYKIQVTRALVKRAILA